MHDKKVKKNLIVAILAAMLCITIIFACVSVSKFVISDKKELTGVYTDFVLSHDGDGQAAVIGTDKNGDDTGYITTTVSNFTEDKVSKRDVRFLLRVPTDEEIAAGNVVDAWGEKHTICQTSKYYEVSVVDDDGVTEVGTTLLAANVRNSKYVLIKIKRKATATAMPVDGTEQVSVILQTESPYKDLQVFTVNTTTARLSAGVSSDEYNGFVRQSVNLKSAIDFVRDGSYNPDVSYRAEVEFTLEGNVVFDAAKYAETYGVTPVFDELNNKYIITIRAGADVNLYFYATGSCTVKVSATIYDGKTAQGAEKISGVSDKILFSR